MKQDPDFFRDDYQTGKYGENPMFPDNEDVSDEVEEKQDESNEQCEKVSEIVTDD